MKISPYFFIRKYLNLVQSVIFLRTDFREFQMGQTDKRRADYGEQPVYLSDNVPSANNKNHQRECESNTSNGLVRRLSTLSLLYRANASIAAVPNLDHSIAEAPNLR